MITFKFIQKIHKLVAKFPDRLEEYKILYPEAFKKVDITDGVKFRLTGAMFETFRLYDGDYYFGEMKPYVQTLQIYNPRRDDPEERKVWSLTCPVEAAYEVEVKTGGSYGFRIFRYGEKKDIVNLEFDSAAEKDRIKEKS